MKSLCLKLPLLLLLLVLVIFPNLALAKSIGPGKGCLEMAEPTGASKGPMKLYYYQPASWHAGDKIVVVIHGMTRNVTGYREYWVPLADENNLLIVCPEFSLEKYPGATKFNLGNVSTTNNTKGTIKPESEWYYSVIDRIIAKIKADTNSPNSKTIVFGHSAGGQFVHRYAMLNEINSADLLIAANPGYYLMPDFSAPFPYGLKKLSYSEERLKEAFKRPLVILAGENDIKRTKNLNQTAYADIQGLTRFDRAFNFYQASWKASKRLKTQFNWKIDTVPGVGHSGPGMSRHAVQYVKDLK